MAPQATHVLRTGEQHFSEDVARLERRLSGTAVSLVLAGGGARAFAHIGVIAELTEAGVRIDRVAGTSMGAYIAGMLALGMSADEIDARTFEEWVRRRPLADYTMPRYALIRGERVRMAMKRTFGEVCIEETPLGLITVSADLLRHTEIVHRHGRMQDAVGPSLALPVLGPPQIYGEQMLVDGAVVNNLPIGHVADLNEGHVIAVDIRGGGDAASGNGPPRELRPPPLGETLMRVLFFGSADTAAATRRHADLVILPRAAGVGFLEFHQIDRAVESGRVAAAEALANAPAHLFAAS
jgi:predicted acylesterase/phospholipase RssA